MNLLTEVIKLLEVPRTHTKVSEAMKEADLDGRMDMKALIKIVGMIADSLDEPSVGKH